MLLAAVLLGACARAAPVPTAEGDATDGPGASSAAGSGAPGNGADRADAAGPAARVPPREIEPSVTVPPSAPPPENLPPVPPPEITEVDLAGLRAEIARFKRAGRPLLVNYWATWCRPCVHELPELGEMARGWGDDGPALLGVSLDRLTAPDGSLIRAQVEKMLLRSRVSYPNRIIRGDQPRVLDTLHIGDGIPVSILYDGAGREAARWTGGINRDEVGATLRGLGAGAGTDAGSAGGAGSGGGAGQRRGGAPGGAGS